MTQVTEDEFAGLVGRSLVHVTAEANLSTIRKLGLLRPVTLAVRAGRSPEELALRGIAEELVLPGGVARLNHQRPLLAGRRAEFLDGVSLEKWSQQLDGRLFFWPGEGSSRFQASVDAQGPAASLAFDARRMFRGFADALDIAPINTGSATRRPARRGTWIYTPVTAAVSTFREARRQRGLVTGRDDVVEVSLRADILPDLLPELLADG